MPLWIVYNQPRTWFGAWVCCVLRLPSWLGERLFERDH